MSLKTINITGKTAPNSPKAPDTLTVDCSTAPPSSSSKRSSTDATTEVPFLNLSARAMSLIENEDDPTKQEQALADQANHPPCTTKMLYIAPKHSRIRTEALNYAVAEHSSENLQFLLDLQDIDEMLDEELKQTAEDCLTDISKTNKTNIHFNNTLQKTPTHEQSTYQQRTFEQRTEEQRKAELVKTPEYQEYLRKIYLTYIAVESRTALNLYTVTRKKLVNVYKNNLLFTMDDFKPARIEIESLVDSDTLKRYGATKQYKKTLDDIQKEQATLLNFKKLLDQYLITNKKHKTSKGCCSCFGPDRTIIYANLELLSAKLQQLITNQAPTETIIDIIQFHQQTHQSEIGKNNHPFNALFLSILTDLKPPSPSSVKLQKN